RRNEAARLERLDRIAAERARRQRRAMAEAGRRAERMHAADDPAHVDALLGRRKLGPAPAAPLEQREPVALVLVQRFAADHERRHDWDVAVRKVEREAVLLEDRFARPAAGPVELRDDEAVADTDLIDAILVARKRDDAAVALEADALDGLEYHFGAQPGIGQLRIHPASSSRRSTGRRTALSPVRRIPILCGSRAGSHTARVPGCPRRTAVL